MTGRVRIRIRREGAVDVRSLVEAETGAHVVVAIRELREGLVTLSGGADVVHPQYQISGENLIYDMNVQHFQGAGGDDNGRIQIRLDPELLEGRDKELKGEETGEGIPDDDEESPAEEGVNG